MRENSERRAAHGLQFNVAQLLKEATGASRTYEVNIPPVDVVAPDISVEGNIVGTVDFLRTGSDILVSGRLETRVRKVCGRCLGEFVVAVSIEVEEIFYPTIDILSGLAVDVPPDADEATRIDAQHILDLWEVIRQDILLSAEEFRYCRPDCKGLCPHCGQDRNLQPCTCQDNLIDERWAGLLSIELEEP